MRKERGFSLLELILVIGMAAILVGVGIFVYLAAIRAWNAAQDRAVLRGALSQAIESMTRDLLQAKSFVVNNTKDLGFSIGADAYHFGFYSSADPSCAYTGTAYDLVKASGVSGCGPGVVMTGNVSVDSAGFSYAGGVVTVDLTMVKDGSTVHMRTKIRPRNLP